MPKQASKSKSRAKTASAAGGRVRQLNRKQTKTKKKKEAQGRKPVPSSFKLTADVTKLIWKHKKVLGGIVLVYLILNIIFASGISSLSDTVSTIKADLNNTGVHSHPFISATTGFLSLIGSGGAVSSATGSTLQTALIILESLVIIWAVRHILAGQRITVKQAYYSAMTPLIPFLLVLVFVFIQLLPLTFGSVALAAVSSSIGTISGLWSLVFSLLLIALAAWSFYMICASIFAVYIVTLPGMLPRQAIRSAKQLVQFRRWIVIRRVLFLPILILAAMAVVVIPLILWATALVAPVFYVLAMLAILFVHSYLYSLYRSLLA